MLHFRLETARVSQHGKAPKKMPYPKNHQQRISLVAGIILITVTLVVGVTVFIVMLRHAEELLSKSLQSSLQNRVQLTQIEIGTGFDRTVVVATRPLLIDQMQRVNAGVGAARLTLNEIAQSFLVTGLTAIALFDKDGHEVAHAGSFTQKPALTVPLALPGRAELIWDGQLLLRTLVDMKRDGRVVAKVMTETSLPATTAAFKEARRLGETGELALCASFGLNMQCFPTTLNPKIFMTSKRSAAGVALPMTHALEGETGFISALDYRHQEVVAAYAPVGDVGLGMVLKMDSAELYAPVWQQLRYLIPLLLGVLIIALLSLRWLLTPLVRRLIRSEAEAAQHTAELTKEIAEHRQAEAELLRFKNVLDNTLDMIFMFEPESLRFVYLNQGALLGTGCSREEWLVMTPYQFTPLMPEPEFRQFIAPLLSGEQSSLHFETIQRRKDGIDFPVDVFLQLVTQIDGSRLFVAIVHDITERKKIEEMKSEFVSVVSHELRTPLTSIRGALGLVNGGVAGELPDNAKAMIQIAYNNSERLLTLINDLLDMDKITSGHMEYELKPHRLTALIEQSIEANAPYGKQYSVRFNFSTAAPQAMIMIDPARFGQVLSNLLSNAAKFSPPGGIVDIKASSADGWITTAVSDQGLGIPAEFHSRIFQKFSQADSSDTRQKGGTGLGLSISKALVENMGGRIWFDTGNGKSTTFYVSFQAELEEA